MCKNSDQCKKKLIKIRFKQIQKNKKYGACWKIDALLPVSDATRKSGLPWYNEIFDKMTLCRNVASCYSDRVKN